MNKHIMQARDLGDISSLVQYNYQEVAEKNSVRKL